MPYISALYTYPVKSLGGIALHSAQVTDRGLKYDRRWMLIDVNNRFLSQREIAKMAMLQVELTEAGLRIYIKNNPHEQILIPYTPQTDEFVMATIWDDVCEAQLVSPQVDKWFSKALDISCKLVYMPDETGRQVDLKYAEEGDITSFSDGYALLMISDASLADLNARLPSPVNMDRFRPNIVISGTQPFEEDRISSFAINNIFFEGVKLCARCVMTTIDQQSGVQAKEPLKTLATYRRKGHKILFGQNIVHRSLGVISVADELRGITFHHDERFIV